MFFLNIFLLLQLENYHNIFFLKKFYTNPKFWYKKFERSKLDFTSKMKFLLFIHIILNIFFLYLIFGFGNIWTMFYVLILFILQPLILVIANIILAPIDLIAKKIIVDKAKVKLKKFKKLKIIWITWSYGKTSQKQILEQLLCSKFKVLSTIGNENTPLWVSRLILNKLDESYEILIVEMWAYNKWDIKELCNIVNPEIWILTGITKQHLERFKNLGNIITAKFELFTNLKKWWFWYYDANSNEILQWMESFQNNLKEINLIGINWNIKFEYLENLSWIKFTYDEMEFTTRLLAPHNILQIITAYKIAKKLWIDSKTLLDSVQNLDYIKHRLELIYNPINGVFVLDDSYNGNIKWVESIIWMFDKAKLSNRKLYLTPWLVELGKDSQKIHFDLGQKLEKNFDKYILIQSQATKSLADWLISVWVNQPDILFYPDTISAHSDLKNILQKWDIIVFQNDWTENYF